MTKKNKILFGFIILVLILFYYYKNYTYMGIFNNQSYMYECKDCKSEIKYIGILFKADEIEVSKAYKRDLSNVAYVENNIYPQYHTVNYFFKKPRYNRKKGIITAKDYSNKNGDKVKMNSILIKDKDHIEYNGFILSKKRPVK